MGDVPDSSSLSQATTLDPLAIEIGTYAHDPLGFVLFAFPWGEAGTVLAADTAPEPWQRVVLGDIGRSLIRPTASGCGGSISAARAGSPARR